MNESEKHIIHQMIRLYCKKNHVKQTNLCPQCEELYDYACQRLEKCKFGEDKPACKSCPVHCYKKDMRKKVQMVMLYSGPRMIWKHPVLAIRHLCMTYRK